MLKTFRFIARDAESWILCQNVDVKWLKQGSTQGLYVIRSRNPKLPAGTLLLSVVPNYDPCKTQWYMSKEMYDLYKGLYLHCCDGKFARLLLDSRVHIVRTGDTCDVFFGAGDTWKAGFSYQTESGVVYWIQRAFYNMLKAPDTKVLSNSEII